MAEGTIQELRSTYGFIRPADGKRRVFFHQTVVKGISFGALASGMEVIYEEGEDEKGVHATIVTLKGKSETADLPYRFLNPYNFISYLGYPQPIPGENDPDKMLLWRCPPPPHDRYLGASGVITCEVTAITPVFIADSHASDENQKHKTVRFFEYEGKPALPATSLRGMVRSMYEAVTNSCFSVFDDRRLSYRLDATKASALLPARIENHSGKWVLRLLPGFTAMSPGQRPNNLYPATIHLYDPLKGRRSRVPKVTLTGLSHEDHCWALVENKGLFTYVLDVAKTAGALRKPSRPSEYIMEGWLCINNQNIDNKRKERFFFRDPGNITGPTFIDIPPEILARYEDLIKDYQYRHGDAVQDRKDKHQPLDDIVGRGPALSRYMYKPEDLDVHEGTLVYAALSGTATSTTIKVLYMAPAAIPRVAYEHTIGELLFDGPRESLHPCKEYKELCPACRMFGWVRKGGSDKQQNLELPLDVPIAYAGRVRFSCGTMKTDGGSLPQTSLAILSSPKPTTTRFYLKPRTKAPQNGMDDQRAGYDGDNILRGRKFYRHQGKANPKEYERVNAPEFDGKDDQNRTIKGAKQPGTTFTFTIEYENLTPVELGALLWSLELREENWVGFHRLGYAKPLGLGSVQIEVTDITICDMQSRYTSAESTAWMKALDQKTGWINHFRNTFAEMYGVEFTHLPNIEDLMALAAEPPELPIHYPRTEQAPILDGKNFEWFMGNKRSGRNAGPRLTLKLAYEDNEGLPILDKYGKER